MSNVAKPYGLKRADITSGSITPSTADVDFGNVDTLATLAALPTSPPALGGWYLDEGNPRLGSQIVWQTARPTGVAAAYSLHRLWPEYTGSLIRVRRDSDDAEIDIGSNSDGFLDLDALYAHCGTGDGFVTTWYDQSGASDDALQATDANQPRIVRNGVIEGIDDYPSLRFGFDPTVNTSIEIPDVIAADSGGYSVLTRSSYDDNNTFMHLIGSDPNNKGFAVLHDGQKLRSFTFYSSGNENEASGNVSYPGLVNHRVDRFDRDTVGGMLIKHNGSTVVTEDTSDLDFAVPTGGGYRIGYGRDTVGLYDFRGYVDTVVVFDRVTTDLEDATLDTDDDGLRANIPASLPYNLTPTTYSNSLENTDETDYRLTSAFASVFFKTSATTIKVTGWNRRFSSNTFPRLTRLGVFVDGRFVGDVMSGLTSGSAEFSRVFHLSDGSKTVEVRNGGRIVSSSAGVYIKTIEANASITQTTPTNTGGLVIYGDSIAVGDDAVEIHTEAYPSILRAGDYAGPIAVEARGSETLKSQGSTAGDRTTLAAKIAALSPSDIWLAIGTNDYALNAWSAADFQTAYADLLTKLNTELPSATIYAQTPLTRSTETGNSFGDTTGDYRTAISNAASGKAYVTVVDGSAILTTGDLSDGVHPTSAGHALIAAEIESELGV